MPGDAAWLAWFVMRSLWRNHLGMKIRAQEYIFWPSQNRGIYNFWPSQEIAFWVFHRLASAHHPASFMLMVDFPIRPIMRSLFILLLLPLLAACGKCHRLAGDGDRRGNQQPQVDRGAGERGRPGGEGLGAGAHFQRHGGGGAGAVQGFGSRGGNAAGRGHRQRRPRANTRRPDS